MVKKGYAYQSLQITAAVEGQTVQVQQGHSYQQFVYPGL